MIWHNATTCVAECRSWMAWQQYQMTCSWEGWWQDMQWKEYIALTYEIGCFLCGDSTHVTDTTVQLQTTNNLLWGLPQKMPIPFPPAFIPLISWHSEVSIQDWAPREDAHLWLKSQYNHFIALSRWYWLVIYIHSRGYRYEAWPKDLIGP